jgi:serine-type D-Ala-D-Ala carboxypeptidase (penicillin-binding protein 5/6)
MGMTLILAPLLAIVSPPAVYDSTAPVAYMVDVASGAALYDRDSNRRIPTASMAKMMTAWVAFEAIKAGKLNPEQKFRVSQTVWKKWNGQGSTMFLKAGEEVSVENLLHGILTLSGNDASIVLAEGMAGSEQAFTERMNGEARILGMKDSHFATANGWPDEGRTFSTARDLSLLAHRIITDHPELFQQYFAQREFRWGGVTQENRNPLLGAIAGADGMKTGHSDEAGYCLVGTVQQGSRRLLMVIAGLPTKSGRLTEARNFMQWGFDAWEAKSLYKKNKIISTIPVQLGEDTQVDLVAPRDLAASLPKGSTGKVTVSVRYKGPIRAPFRKGDELAQLVVKLPGGGQQVMPLVAAKSVGEAGFFGRAWNGVKSLVGA